LDILKNNESVARFEEIATANIGIVTGANKYFVVPDAVVAEYGLARYTKPMYGRSSLVKGVVYSEDDHRENAAAGKDVNFLHFNGAVKISDKAEEYIRQGEAQSLHTRYKCRIRSPWYEVPYVQPSDISMLKRSHYYPRVIHNSFKVYTTDTAYRIKMKEGFEAYSMNLVYGFVNSLTALSAELEGRHYGGGVIELVPSEIKHLSVPLILDFHRLDELDDMFKAGVESIDILKRQDDVLLAEIGLSHAERRIIHDEYLMLMNRRIRNH
jgi:adenine-specific DNA methylase